MSVHKALRLMLVNIVQHHRNVVLFMSLSLSVVCACENVLFNSHIGPSQGSSRFASVLSSFTISIKRVNDKSLLMIKRFVERYVWS